MLEYDESMMSYNYYCDGASCDAEVIVDDLRNNYSLKMASEEIKSKGWRIVYDEDLKQFYHYCPECKNNY